MKVKAANGLVRALRKEGVTRVSCYPTNHVNNACGEEGMPMIMVGEERHAVALADATSRVTCGRDIGVCTVMANLNAAGIRFKDLHTTQSSLEDIFVTLVKAPMERQ